MHEHVCLQQRRCLGLCSSFNPGGTHSSQARSQPVTRMYSAGLLKAAFHYHVDWDHVYLFYKPQEKQPFDLALHGWMVWSTHGIGNICSRCRLQKTDDELKSFKHMTLKVMPFAQGCVRMSRHVRVRGTRRGRKWQN